LTPQTLPALATFDRAHFPAPREAFLRRWTASDAHRTTRLLWRGDALAGYGVIRTCRDGTKIGPLFAEDAETARRLFCALAATRASGETVSLDVPEDNPAAVALAETAGLAPVFETARMYLGPPPALPLQRIFGVTTFELG
ncbi:MAG: GNAT family N-acetyltransferase, partial [Pseudomonadota bacterium]